MIRVESALFFFGKYRMIETVKLKSGGSCFSIGESAAKPRAKICARSAESGCSAVFRGLRGELGCEACEPSGSIGGKGLIGEDLATRLFLWCNHT